MSNNPVPEGPAFYIALNWRLDVLDKTANRRISNTEYRMAKDGIIEPLVYQLDHSGIGLLPDLDHGIADQLNIRLNHSLDLI